jgi:enamine deaminase RidA (YjgF/YER057c/UK114 family)
MLDEAAIDDSPFKFRSFDGAVGGSEYYISVTAPPRLGLRGQLEYVQARYAEAERALGLRPETAVFRRLFLSDAINQTAIVRESALFRAPEDSPVAVSIVQQPPLGGAKVALLAYHVAGDGMKKRRLSPKHLLVEKNGLRHLWSTRLCAGAHGAPACVETQTWEVFSDLIGTISGKGGTLQDHCVRTWIYIKDVDVFYRGMVESRGKVFSQHGMTEATHYIASTGIEGACAHQYDVVLMDAYSNLDLVPGQMSYLHDLDKLCPTKDYKVHFERGSKISYRDRAHYFISGTASIDKTGRVVHPGNVLKQLERALTNVQGLLASGEASIADMTHLIVYVRDASDFEPVGAYLSERFPRLPTVFVQGPVCRPDWLVEIEAIAIAAHNVPQLPSF